MSNSKCMLDTDTLSYYFRDVESVVQKGEEYIRTRGRFTISVITVFEIRYGYRKIGSKRKEETFLDFCRSAEILSVNEAVAHRAAIIYVDLEQQGQPLDLPDILVASIALENNLTLVTNNQKHFGRIEGLKLDNWLS